MNGTDIFTDVDMNKICRACLRSDVDLNPMPFELKNWYISFVDKTANQDYEIMICTICRWIFNKLAKFINQCQTANEILNKASLMDNKPKHIKYLRNSHNFISSVPKVFSIILNSDTNIKSEEVTKTIKIQQINDDSNELFENSTQQYDSNSFDQNSTYQYQSNSQNSSQQYNHSHDSYLDSTEQYKSNNSQQSKLHSSYKDSAQQYETVFENSDQQYIYNETLKVEYSGDEFQNDDDDVPLVMLKIDDSESRRKKKRKRLQKIDDLSTERDSKPKVKCKKGTKQLKEGFSSRMVQETKEYTVIKLNREQVINEMEQRSKTEEYLRYPYKCEKCVKGFNFDDVLQSHMEKHVSDNGNFQCDMCYQYCANAVSLRGHIKSHTTRYKCKLCGQVRLARQHLLEHYTNIHSNQPITYKCESCEFTTNKRTVMQRHVRSHNTSELHACDKCGKLYKNMETLRVHTTIHDKSRFQCKQCKATFVYQTLLKKHEVSVHQRRDYYCVECDIEFKTKISLNLHFKRSKKHRDSSIITNSRTSQPVECSICLRNYSNRDTLRAHIYRAHRNRNNIEILQNKPKETYENKIEV